MVTSNWMDLPGGCAWKMAPGAATLLFARVIVSMRLPYRLFPTLYYVSTTRIVRERRNQVQGSQEGGSAVYASFDSQRGWSGSLQLSTRVLHGRERNQSVPAERVLERKHARLFL